MLKNNSEIFALCDSNLHDDIGYLPIHRNDARHMHSLDVKSNLPITGETILEDENENYVFSFGSSTYIPLPSYFSYFVCHFGHLVLWLRLCHPILTRHLFPNPLLMSWYVVTSMPITLSVFIIPIALMLQVCSVKSLLLHNGRLPYSHP